eukprot:13737215-Ditylum_brightwellii.AAC.1
MVLSGREGPCMGHWSQGCKCHPQRREENSCPTQGQWQSDEQVGGNDYQDEGVGDPSLEVAEGRKSGGAAGVAGLADGACHGGSGGLP